MAEERNADEQRSEFLCFADNFHQYSVELVEGTIEQIKNDEDKLFVRNIGNVALHITSNLRRELRIVYEQVEGDMRQSLDDSTNLLGGNALLDNTLDLMRRDDASRRVNWSKILKIAEAVKKILDSIVQALTPLGIIPGSILNITSKMEDILKALDNILQTIAEVFGGRALRQRMHEEELQVLRVKQEVARLKKIRYS